MKLTLPVAPVTFPIQTGHSNPRAVKTFCILFVILSPSLSLTTCWSRVWRRYHYTTKPPYDISLQVITWSVPTVIYDNMVQLLQEMIYRSSEDAADPLVRIPDSDGLRELNVKHVVTVKNVVDFVKDHSDWSFADQMTLRIKQRFLIILQCSPSCITVQ